MRGAMKLAALLALALACADLATAARMKTLKNTTEPPLSEPSVSSPPLEDLSSPPPAALEPTDVSGTDGYCPDGATSCIWPYMTNTSSVVVVFDPSVNTTRDSAAAYCDSLGAGWDLASIESEEDMLELAAHSINYTITSRKGSSRNVTAPSTLVGLVCTVETACNVESSFEWTDNTTTNGTVFWRSRYPKDNGACVVLLQPSGLVNQDCALTVQQFACKGPLPPPPPPPPSPKVTGGSTKSPSPTPEPPAPKVKTARPVCCLCSSPLSRLVIPL